MVSQNKRDSDKAAKADSGSASNVNTAEHLQPFQDAAIKFAQANFSANHEKHTQCAEAQLVYQGEIRKVEIQAQQSTIEANKKYITALGATAGKPPEEIYSLSLKAQIEFENELRQIYFDSYTKAQAIDNDREPLLKEYAENRQEAYKAYLADLKTAWSNIDYIDPRTIHAIASNVLSTINSC